jgi:hypothetical protein
MSEQLIVFESGDRFATLSDDGMATVWAVGMDGIPHVVRPVDRLLPGAEALLSAPRVDGPAGPSVIGTTVDGSALLG